MSNITEELFGAISLITAENIKKIPLDKTIICRIIDASKKSEGKYRVQNGDISFYAFADGASYAKDDEVRVVVPSDDTKQKYILGKYVKDDGSPVNYVSPADSIINISGNILSDNGDEDRLFLAAGGAMPTSTEGLATSLEKAGNILNTVYDTLVIEGDFRTLLQNDRTGEYGIDVVIYGSQSGTVTAQQYTLSSKDMFGDPYNFQVYTPQAKAFALPKNLGDGVEVEGVRVAFYQRGFNETCNYKNVLIRNLNIWFGSDASKIEDKTSKIYTTNSLSYKYYDPTEATNQKELNLLWYRKNEDGSFIQCSFDGESNGFNELKEQQIDNKVKAQMGKKNGPKTLKQLYAAAALSENKKNAPAFKKLVENDIKQLINSMASEAGKKEDFTSLSKVGEGTGKCVENLETQLKLYSGNGNWDSTESDALDKKKTNILKALDDFFNGTDSLENATGIFNRYKAKWLILRAKINSAYGKLNVYGFGNSPFESMTGDAWAKEVIVDTNGEIVLKGNAAAASREAENSSKYSCFWFVYDEQYDNADEIEMQVAGQHWRRIEEYDNETTLSYDCDPVLKTQQFKCIVFEDANYYQSNILEFTNSDEIPSGATLDQADSLVLVHGEKHSRDSYLLYGDDGYLVDNKDSLLIRTIACEYEGVKAGNEALNGAVVYWYLPKAGTMLRKAYSNDDDYKNKCGLILQTEGSAASKYSDHYCYSRTIEMAKKKGTKQEAAEDGTLYDVEYELDEYEFANKSNEFYYGLGEFYEPNAANNSIICEAYLLDETRTANDPVFAQQWFTIGQKGTCGTGYTLSVTHVNDQVATTDSKNLNLRVQLFDEDGSDCTEGREFAVEWVNHNGNGTLGFNENTITVPSGNYGILKVSTVIYENRKDINAAILYAVPWSAEKGQTYLFSGCTKVIYTTLGALDYPSLYRQAYSLMDHNGNEVQGLTWELEESKDVDEFSSNYYPTVQTKGGKYYLEPVDMYLTNLAGWCWVEAKQGAVSLWKQPIIIMQSKYGSSVLNDWNGDFKIDEDAGTVMGTMFAAGRKTDDNTFEGVIMGDVQAGLQNSKAGKTGLYGFNDGIESFGLKIDGTAFFGKPGNGQILIDGNKGMIRSAEWTKDPINDWRTECHGMEINLDDATIRMVGSLGYEGEDEGTYSLVKAEGQSQNTRKRNYNTTGGLKPNIIISASPAAEGDPYFEIQGVGSDVIPIIDDENKIVTGFTSGASTLIKVANEEYYLKSLNFPNDEEKASSVQRGTKIDIKNGKITSYNFQVNAFDGNEQTIWLNSNPAAATDYYFKVGKDNGSFMSLTKDGTLDIQANKLTLASPLSNANLLRNTRPCELASPLTYGWKDGNTQRCNQSHKDCIKLHGKDSQEVEWKKNVWYTLSGNLLQGEFRVDLPGGKSYNQTETGYFEYTFKVEDIDSGNRIEFNGSSAHLRHLKLEQNTSATPWCEHTDDAAKYSDDKDDLYDAQLNQDKVFNRLTNNGAARGIFLNGNQLFINADYISTGIIRSNNWKGTYTANAKTYENIEDYLTAKEEDYVVQNIQNKSDEAKQDWNKNWEPTIAPTEGMYINLNEGKIWAKDFELNAWKDSQGLYINSCPPGGESVADPELAYYLKLGNSQNYITMSSSGEIQFYTEKSFIVKAVPAEGEYGGFLYLNSNGSGVLTAGTGENSIEYKNAYFGVGRLEVSPKSTDDPSYMIFADNKLNLKGNIIADGGKIGGFNIGKEQLSVWSDHETEEKTIRINFSFQGIRPLGEDTSEVYTVTRYFSLSDRITSIACDERQDLYLDGNQKDVGGVFFPDQSDIQTTTESVKLLDGQSRDYVTKIVFKLYFTTPQGFSDFPQGAAASGYLKATLKIDNYTEAKISSTGIIAESVTCKEIDLLTRRVKELSDLNGLGEIEESAGITSSPGDTFQEIFFKATDNGVIKNRGLLTYNSWSYRPSGGAYQKRLLFEDDKTILRSPQEIACQDNAGNNLMRITSEHFYFDVSSNKDFQLQCKNNNDQTITFLQVSSTTSYFNLDSSRIFKFTANGNSNTIFQISSSEALFDLGTSRVFTIKVSGSNSIKVNKQDNVATLTAPRIIVENKIEVNDLIVDGATTLGTTLIKQTGISAAQITLDAATGSISANKLTVTTLDASSGSIDAKDITVTTLDVANKINGGGLGKLAFADSVKKNFDVSITGTVTLTKDISSDLQAYEYTVVTQETDGHYVNVSIGYSGTTPYTYTDAEGNSQTVDVSYSGTVPYSYWYPRTVSTTTCSGKKYTGNSNISITEEVTLKGNTDLELGPSNIETETESISISGTQQ